jgi:hypothetical protein
MGVRPNATPVREALDVFLDRYGFSRDEYDEKRYWIEVGGRRIGLPNPRSRRVMVPLHDLHHVATGYAADLRGEAEIGAWELRAGCTTAALWIINIGATLMGVVLAPRRTLAAFRAGARATTLYRLKANYADVLDLTVGELRDLLGVGEPVPPDDR